MNHDVKVVHPLDDDVLDAGCVGVCTGAVVTALSYRPRALLPPASHASLTAAPMLVAVAAARFSRSLYVVYAAYPCFICAKDGIVLMVHLRYVSGTMMRVWNGPNHGHHRPWRPPGRQGLSSPCGAVWLFQLHEAAPGQHLHRQNRQKALHQTRIPPFPHRPNTQRGEIADRTVPGPDPTSGQIGITQRIVPARRMGDPGKGQLFSVWPISASTFRTESDRSSNAGHTRPSLNICI